MSRQAIDLRRFPWFRRLAADYAFDFPKVASFFAGDPRSDADWRDAIARTQTRTRHRDRIADILAAQQMKRGAPPESVAAVERLRDPRTVAVVTGQQAGVFGGPLYTLLKAITAIRLAGRATRDFGVPAIAIFWIDAEDHDWDEVASTTLLDPAFRARDITLPRPEAAGDVPVASLTLDGSIGATLSTLREVLDPTEFTDETLAAVSRAYVSGNGMADAFGKLIESVLGRFGLVLFDCADPAAKPLVADVFAHELSEPAKTSALAADAGRALESRGYHAQVTAHDEGVALFHLDGGRQPIRYADGRYSAGDRSYGREELVALARTSPEQFSPNVLLRPLVQDALFPTVCYVAGPSELAYLGQLRPVYARFGIPMPLVHPRATATILDSSAARFLNKYRVELESLAPQDEAALNRLLEAQLPPDVEAALTDARRTIEERMAAVVAAVPLIDPTLEGAAKSTLGKMSHELRTLHSKIIHAAKKRDETLRRQFARAQAQAFPAGNVQERTLGFIYFLNRFGPGLVDALVAELPLDLGQHWVLTP